MPGFVHHAGGTVLGRWSTVLTIRIADGTMSVDSALVRGAQAVTLGDFPYVYGGGHATAGAAGTGSAGPGYDGHTDGFDCSGSVAAVLAGANLWPAGAGVPNDAGVISELQARHLVAAGASTATDAVNFYDDPGFHIFMSINGRYFGTSDGGGGGNWNGGAGWLADGAWDTHNKSYHAFHLLPSVVTRMTSAGHFLTVHVPLARLSRVWTGSGVAVTFVQLADGRYMDRTLTVG